MGLPHMRSAELTRNLRFTQIGVSSAFKVYDLIERFRLSTSLTTPGAPHSRTAARRTPIARLLMS